ncbi:pilus assembly protein [Pseudomonas turukhanskensis]|uniref:Type IV pilus biogenesis factor PilY1 n=1 Tax=Pseudomonas turukhanskensis TaxID=1806536 RepID=A0A9W6NEX1_9PSED|nr:PilC/PilY family type IV pilus protein [Pseudomonas turukhanskensis]GLK89109.1 type IV pilus biogenesis factor PilY1 [Pseudomonas turukhanskensis]
MTSRHPPRSLFSSLLLLAALHVSPAAATGLNLSQVPLFLTEGVAPNIMVTIDNSQSMRWAFAPDTLSPVNSTDATAIRTSRRAKSATFNPLYYNPTVTYTPPYAVSYNDATVTSTPLTTSFTAAYVNGFKSTLGSHNLATGYMVAWDYDTSRGTSTASNFSYSSSIKYDTTGIVYYLAANPTSDFAATTAKTTNTAGTATTTSNVTYSTNVTSCPASIPSTSSKSSTTTTTGTNVSTGASVTTSSYVNTVTSYSSITCTQTSTSGTKKYTVKVTTTVTPTTTTTVSAMADKTTSAVPAYYYLYNSALSGCTASIDDDNCYKLVTVSASSGTGGTDERQNFANWYSFYRNRELATQSAANLAFSELSSATRLSWQALGTSDTCITSTSYLTTSNCRGLTNSSTSYYDNRLRDFSGSHRAQFFAWLSDIYYNQSTPLLAAIDRVGTLLTSTGANGPYAKVVGSTEKPIYSCRASYSITMTDGIWNTVGSHGDYDNTERALPDDGTYKPLAPFMDSTSNTLADLTFKYWMTDAQKDVDNNVPTYTKESGSGQYWNPKNDPATWQHMVSYFVGLGLTKTLTDPAWGGDTYSGDYSALVAKTKTWPAASPNSSNNVYDLWHAAINSRGEFFSADSPDSLLSALKNIVTRINETSTASASQAISSPLTDSDYSSANTYIPSFSSEDWSGTLIKYERTTSSATEAWNAQTLLDTQYPTGNTAYSSRPVYIAGGTASSGLQSFTWANLSGAQQTTLNKALDSTVDSNGSKRVSWLRGDRSNESTLLRSRSHILGDIVDSTPVLVTTPSSPAAKMNALVGDSSYTDFKAEWASRGTRVYVGANDGMLHAFDDAGKETFAFIPSSVISNLYKLMDPDYTSSAHQYYVDGTPTVADVYFSNAWHTVLVGTLRGGGRALFALDITDPANIKLLWEKSYSDSAYAELGYTYAKPVIARLHSGDWAVIAANGVNSTNDKAVLYVINVQDGALIKALTTTDSASGANGLSSPYVADIDGDLIADYVYAGDLHGNLWRFDLISIGGSLTDSAISSTFRVAFGGSPLYTAAATSTAGASNTTQPITSSPYVIAHPSGTGHLVIFGTGKYMEAADAAADTTKAMSVYGIWDTQTAGEYTTSTPTLTSSKLQAQTFGANTTITYTSTSGSNVTTTANTLSSNAVSWFNNDGSIKTYGWYLNLPLTGEMVVNKPLTVSSSVLITSLAPNDDPCQSGASTYLTLIDPYTGGASTETTLELGQTTTYSRIQLNSLIGGASVLSLDGQISLHNSDSSDGGVGVSGQSNERQSWREVRLQE